jgi:hypothetical protein
MIPYIGIPGQVNYLMNQSRSVLTDATPAANPAYCTLELGVEMAFSAGSATLVDIGQNRMLSPGVEYRAIPDPHIRASIERRDFLLPELLCFTAR